jgi:hypothetical protein
VRNMWASTIPVKRPCHASGVRLVCAIVETGGSLA